MDILPALEFACYGYMAAFDHICDLAGGQSLMIQTFDDKALVPLEVLTFAPPLLFHCYSPFTNTVNCVCEKSIPQYIDKIQDIVMRYFTSTRYAKDMGINTVKRKTAVLPGHFRFSVAVFVLFYNNFLSIWKNKR